jgi:hypothetical protein
MNNFLFIGETFQINANTDAWCRSKEIIPATQYGNGVYAAATCGGTPIVYMYLGTKDAFLAKIWGPTPTANNAILFACESP